MIGMCGALSTCVGSQEHGEIEWKSIESETAHSASDTVDLIPKYSHCGKLRRNKMLRSVSNEMTYPTWRIGYIYWTECGILSTLFAPRASVTKLGMLVWRFSQICNGFRLVAVFFPDFSSQNSETWQTNHFVGKKTNHFVQKFQYTHK